MELGEKGDLQKHIELRKKKIKESGDMQAHLFKEEEVLDIIAQVVRAIHHIHELQVLHRDIKLSNLFLKEDGRVKLGDFGIAKVLTDKSKKAKSIVGSPYYLAPEIIQAKPYDYSAEVWAIGVLTYYLCTLSPPFQSSNRELSGLFKNIRNGKPKSLPEYYSKDIWNMIKCMLKKEPAERPKINQIMKHPLLIKRIKQMEIDHPSSMPAQSVVNGHSQAQESDLQDNRDEVEMTTNSEATDNMNSSYKSVMSMKSIQTTGESEYGDLKPEDQELFQLCGKEDEFVAKMSEEFGDDLFAQAYQIMKDNMQDVFDDSND